jgi:hypothetical protein
VVESEWFALDNTAENAMFEKASATPAIKNFFSI